MVAVPTFFVLGIGVGHVCVWCPSVEVEQGEASVGAAYMLASHTKLGPPQLVGTALLTIALNRGCNDCVWAKSPARPPTRLLKGLMDPSPWYPLRYSLRELTSVYIQVTEIVKELL